MITEPNYKECLQVLEEALGTLQFLALYACSEEKIKLERTCEQLLQHIYVLRAIV